MKFIRIPVFVGILDREASAEHGDIRLKLASSHDWQRRSEIAVTTNCDMRIVSDPRNQDVCWIYVKDGAFLSQHDLATTIDLIEGTSNVDKR